jgi:hypothetical protein
MVDRAPNFRFIPSNTFSLALGAEQAILKFGLAEDPAKPDNVWEQIGVVTNLKAAKEFMLGMEAIILAYERDFGPIQIDQNKIDTMKASLARGQPNPSPNASPPPS